MPLNAPLKIAVQDGNGFSPFSIAVLRGHNELARKIVEICAAQYHKDDGLRKRFRTIVDSEDEDVDEDSDVENSDDKEGNHFSYDTNPDCRSTDSTQAFRSHLKLLTISLPLKTWAKSQTLSRVTFCL
jgi:hypothetical protein